MITIPPPVVVAAVAVLAACVFAACVAAWVRFCRTERAADVPVEARAAAADAAADAHALIQAMHAQHRDYVDSERSRWDAEPDTTELDTITAHTWPVDDDDLAQRWARAAASGWWLP